MLAHTGPIEEGLEALFVDEGSIEVMVMAEASWATVEVSTAHVLPTEGDAAETIATDGSDTRLMRGLGRQAVRIPFPCNGMGATALYTEGRDTHCAVGKVPEESLVGIERGDDVIFEEEDPWCRAERGNMRVDA